MNEPVAVWPISMRAAHWISAALVLGSFGLGLSMVHLVQDSGRRFDLTQTHKSIGVVVLILTSVRLSLRLMTAAPPPMPVAPYVLRAARAVHTALYALLLLMPLSGWLMASTTPVRVPTIVFSLFELPYPLAPHLAIYQLVHGVHVVSAMALGALIAFHISAVLVHTFCWRGPVLARMWPTQSVRFHGLPCAARSRKLGDHQAPS